MNRFIRQPLTLASIGLALALASACNSTKSDVPDSMRSNLPTTGSELKLLKFANYLMDASIDAEYFGYAGDASSFDPVMLYGLGHGQFKEQTAFQVSGRPTHAKPTRIILMAGGGGNQLTSTIDASNDHFIVSVDASWSDPTKLTVVAYNDDGTLATVK